MSTMDSKQHQQQISRLQTVSNYFLLSLALADLLIGLISMPLYTLYLLLNYWPLGPLMCDIWLAIDYMNSNAAVLNMLIISFDRYFSVTRPLTYRAKRTTKHACLMISCAWILSLTIWTPAIFTYPYYKGRTVQGTDKCEIEFVKANTYLTFVTAMLAFYIPVIIIIYLYWRIWLETKKRYRDLTTLFLVSGVGAAAPARATRPIHNTATSNQALPLNQASSSQHRPSIPRNIKLSLVSAKNNNESSTITNDNSNNNNNNNNSNNRSSFRASSCDSHKRRQFALVDQMQQKKPLFASNQKLSNYKQTTDMEAKNKSMSNYQGSKNVIQQQQQQQQNCRCPCCTRNIKGIKIKKSPKRCSPGCNYRLSNTLDNCSKCQQHLKDHPAKCNLCNQICYVKCSSCSNNNSTIKQSRENLGVNDSQLDGMKTNTEDMGPTQDLNDDNKPNTPPCVTGVGRKRLPSGHNHNHNHNHQSHFNHAHNHNHGSSSNNHYHHHHHHHHSHHRSSRHCGALSNATLDGGKSASALIHHGGHHHYGHHSHHNHKLNRKRNLESDQINVHSIADKQQGKLSLLTSSYQLLSSNTKSLSGASILRKVHPTNIANNGNNNNDINTENDNHKLKETETENSNSNNNNDDDDDDDDDNNNHHDGNDNGDENYNANINNSTKLLAPSTNKKNLDETAGKGTTLSSGAFTCKTTGANYVALGNSEPIFNKITSSSPVEEAIKTVDTATSPIQFPSSPTRLNFADEDSHLDRDFETRIVSSGDRFRFESDDLRLSPMFAKEGAKRSGREKEIGMGTGKDKTIEGDSSRIQAKKAKEVALKRSPNCKHCHRDNTLPLCYNSSRQGVHSNRCCCAEVISDHDSDCRICHPIGGAHRSHFSAKASSGDCLECSRLISNPNSKTSKSKQTSELTRKEQNSDVQSEQTSKQENKLPILGVLRKCSEAETKGDGIVSRDNHSSEDLMVATRDSGRGDFGDILPTILGGSKTLDNIPGNLSPPKEFGTRKKPKKFSQKLTFSDILIERTNSQRDENSDSSKSRFTDTFSIQFRGENEGSQEGNICGLNQDRNINQANNPGLNNSATQQRYSKWLSIYLDWIGSLFRRSVATNNKVLVTSPGDEYDEKATSKDPTTKIFKSSTQNRQQNKKFPNLIDTSKRRNFLNKLCCSNKNLTSQLSSRNTNRKLIKQGNETQNRNHSSSTDDSDNTGGNSRNNNSGLNNSSCGNTKYSSHHPIQPKSERKAAKTLSTLLLVFIVTWLPYNVLVLIKTLSGGEDQVPEKIWNFSYYLCYINSTINPLCYALCNAQFRRTYMRILKCKLSNEHNSTRRLVPLQSSTTWNKDLRLTTPETNSTNQISSAYSASNHNGYNLRHTRS